MSAPVGYPLSLHDLRGGHLRGTEAADLAGRREVSEGREGFVDIGVGVGCAPLI